MVKHGKVQLKKLVVQRNGLKEKIKNKNSEDTWIPLSDGKRKMNLTTGEIVNI